MKGLIIKQPWIDLILEGRKVWEIRGSNTKIRGRIALIQSGTKTVVGYADLVDCIPVSQEEYPLRKDKHCIDDCSVFPYKYVYAWVLRNPVRIKKPIPYEHKLGTIIWVNLPDSIWSE